MRTLAPSRARRKFTARLADTGVYKYTVTARKGANTYVLDPVIIVGR